ncbi:hypothetical protein DK389_05375 [Methylobacterium durans]|uniref:Uncharacterized protein n=1 Tax=Methylobacterium durans TaxID=2202825 RepID=A0A2U8W468_9HYPH|nr:hypothetical protein DK389_05375 [Methylobacterium durans]
MLEVSAALDTAVAAMKNQISRSAAYWRKLERTVSAKVGVALSKRDGDNETLILYLRDLEKVARAECDRAETIQIIASGRRLLGDQSTIRRAGPPARYVTAQSVSPLFTGAAPVDEGLRTAPAHACGR